MSHVHYEILVNLSEAPEHTLRMNRLAERSLCSRSRLTHAVDRLEKAGWVRRIACPTDGRGSFAELTDTGLNALETATPGHIAAVRSLFFQVLTPHQQESLREIGEAIVAHLTSGPMSPP
ncbi:MarR family transcriptional regulator [Streptomyces malaysiensis]|uniref:MarR family transcriptional regulator n=2 Tax=Streptomyces malaysiensis TaxID=92644 RepID=A0A7X5XBL3_STRMQ|nr:MarR family transcriptional regulator [Streptomyces malaysiensis]